MIALDKEHEDLLRKLAQEKYSGKKGSLTLIVQEALEKMKENSKDNKIVSLKSALSEGVKFSYKMYKNRSEIYD